MTTETTKQFDALAKDYAEEVVAYFMMGTEPKYVFDTQVKFIETWFKAALMRGYNAKN